MSRLKELRQCVNERLMKIDEKKRMDAVNHLYGVSLSAAAKPLLPTVSE